MKRTERLMALAEHLRGRRSGATAEQLAKRFGVTMRTMYRDLDSLRDASLPILADRGRGGGYALDRSYILPPVNFTAREAAVLLTVGEWVVAMRMLPFTQALRSSLDKVRAALGATAQRETMELMRQLQFTGVPSRQVDVKVCAVLEQAWFEQRGVRLTYDGAKHVETTHDVTITGVLLERNETLVVGKDAVDGTIRPFKLHHVRKAQLL